MPDSRPNRPGDAGRAAAPSARDCRSQGSDGRCRKPRTPVVREPAHGQGMGARVGLRTAEPVENQRGRTACMAVGSVPVWPRRKTDRRRARSVPVPNGWSPVRCPHRHGRRRPAFAGHDATRCGHGIEPPAPEPWYCVCELTTCMRTPSCRAEACHPPMTCWWAVKLVRRLWLRNPRGKAWMAGLRPPRRGRRRQFANAVPV